MKESLFKTNPCFWKTQGFTLIELLAVIMIIGILASVVLIVYPGAFKKVKDGRIQSGISQFKTQAFILYKNDKSYSGLNCTIVGESCSCPDKTVEMLCGEVQANSDQDFEIRIDQNEQGFCAFAHLPGEDKFLCIDSAFNATTTAASPATCQAACEPADDCKCLP